MGRKKDTNTAVDLIIYMRAKRGWRIDTCQNFQGQDNDDLSDLLYDINQTNCMLQLHNDTLVSCWLLSPTAFRETKGMKYIQYSHWLNSKDWSKTVEDVTDNHHMTKCMTVCNKEKIVDGKWGVWQRRGQGGGGKRWWSNAWDNQCELETDRGFSKGLMNQI